MEECPDNGQEVRAAEVQQELAEERTAMALQRTVLANERTLNSWLRTGLATIAAGFTLGVVLGQDEPGAARLFGVALIAVGGVIGIIGLVRYRALRTRLEYQDVSTVPLWLLQLLVGFFLLMSLIGAGLLVLRP